MASMEAASLPDRPDAEIGRRLRARREEVGLSLRKLAARLEISPSALSQIETGRSRPSVRTLYAIVSELGMSFDELFPANAARAGRGRADSITLHGLGHGLKEIVTRASERNVIEMASGVTWERLNPTGDRDIDFLQATYDVGGASSAGDTFMRHSGREYGLVVEGRLRVTVGFDEYELEPGDSICFDSQWPHRLATIGDKPVKAVWFVIGRYGSDDRADW
jgi:transcriptional regulator with XRE-family HTH domain